MLTIQTEKDKTILDLVNKNAELQDEVSELRSILLQCINQGTYGHVAFDASLDELRTAPSVFANMKAKLEKAEKQNVAAIQVLNGKLEEVVERVWGAKPTHIEKRDLFRMTLARITYLRSRLTEILAANKLE